MRHLHRLFSSQGGTLGGCIRERRLQHCQADLADPRFLPRTITEIALFWGFSDSAHFSHCFKQRFGISPREFRARVTSGSGHVLEPPLSLLGAIPHFRHLN